MPPIDYDRAAEAGAAWLDEVAPTDWFDRIDLDRLDISAPCDCVGGQVFPAGDGNPSGFTVLVRLARADGPRSSASTWDWLEAHGFDAATGAASAYRELAEAWRREVRFRRAEVSNDVTESELVGTWNHEADL